MSQTHIFESTDYGDLTLAKLDGKGIEMTINAVETTTGKWGDFVTLMGVFLKGNLADLKKGDTFEIRAGGRAAEGFQDKKSVIIGRNVSIIPHGSGMDRKYSVDYVD